MTYSDLVFKCEMDKGIEESRQHYERMMFKEALRTAFFEYQAARDRYREKCMDGMHIDLVMRFVETQTLILSPICPHICEYIWHTLLKKKKLIVCESWPIVGQPDKLLLRSAAYLDDAAHEFRLRTKEFIQTKRSKPTHAVIWVAKTYPPWQNLILTKLRSIYDRKKELPDNKSISTELGREETLEKRMKNAICHRCQGKLYQKWCKRFQLDA